MRKFGLIGYPLSHSFSQKYFREKFKKDGITDAAYENFPLARLGELPVMIASHPDLLGLNVTIPYKQEVLTFLAEKNNIVAQTGACNCIRISGGRLSGYNTDVIGFEVSLQKKLKPWHTDALILGTGGASKAVEYVLGGLGIRYFMVSRNPAGGSNMLGYGQLTSSVIQSHLLIINTSPVGMFPQVSDFPPLAYEALSDRHYLFDLIYNPSQTLFLQKGEQKGASIQNGLDMLVIQAEESWKIWNPPDQL
jgi:shikimate dehydrogenase